MTRPYWMTKPPRKPICTDAVLRGIRHLENATVADRLRVSCDDQELAHQLGLDLERRADLEKLRRIVSEANDALNWARDMQNYRVVKKQYDREHRCRGRDSI